MNEFTAPAVLIVDDDPIIRSFLQSILQREYVVLLAEDGVRALEIVGAFSGQIRLLVSDLCMPRMGGLESSRRIVAERPEIRILLMSGGAPGDWPAEDRRYAFVAKPFTSSVVRSAIDRLLSEAHVPLRSPSGACVSTASRG